MFDWLSGIFLGSKYLLKGGVWMSVVYFLVAPFIFNKCYGFIVHCEFRASYTPKNLTVFQPSIFQPSIFRCENASFKVC